ncbi:hypothetical protein GQ457_14G016610 [Hibiscus cannabinus]
MWEDFPGSRDATAYWSAEKTKQPRYFAAHMALLQELHIKGADKRELGRKEREEKVKRDPTIVELQARVLLHLWKDSKLKSTATSLGISFLLFPCTFILWVAKETEKCWLFCPYP